MALWLDSTTLGVFCKLNVLYNSSGGSGSQFIFMCCSKGTGKAQTPQFSWRSPVLDLALTNSRGRRGMGGKNSNPQVSEESQGEMASVFNI